MIRRPMMIFLAMLTLAACSDEAATPGAANVTVSADEGIDVLDVSPDGMSMPENAAFDSESGNSL